MSRRRLLLRKAEPGLPRRGAATGWRPGYSLKKQMCGLSAVFHQEAAPGPTPPKQPLRLRRLEVRGPPCASRAFSPGGPRAPNRGLPLVPDQPATAGRRRASGRILGVTHPASFCERQGQTGGEPSGGEPYESRPLFGILLIVVNRAHLISHYESGRGATIAASARTERATGRGSLPPHEGAVSHTLS